MSVNGILAINKPVGMSSRGVVNRVQRITGVRKCGHAGTLDPLASGVLVVCLGQATRLIRFVQKMQKQYHARFRFGVTSDTDDLEATLIQTVDPQYPSSSELQNLLAESIGEIDQVPPKYSAVNIQGRRAYQLARQGKNVELKSRKVTISQFQLLEYEPPDWEARIICGSGTYIRSLGRDLGQKFGCGALMTFLSREAIGNFTLQNSVSIKELELENWQDYLQPPVAAVTELPFLKCDAEQITDIRHGKALAVINDHSNEKEIAMLDSQGNLIAIAEINHELQVFKPRIVLGE